jgi:hypothetical protein
VEQLQRDIGVESEEQRRAPEGLAGLAAHQDHALAVPNPERMLFLENCPATSD